MKLVRLPSSIAIPIASALTAMLVTTGRCSRKGLAICAAVLLALQAAYLGGLVLLDVSRGAAFYILDVVFLWLGTCAVAKRLHDLGLPAVRIVWAAVAVVVWSLVAAAVVFYVVDGAGALDPNRRIIVAALVASLPVFAMMLWLLLVPGMPGPNRYGIAPSVSGFCAGLPLGGVVAQKSTPSAPGSGAAEAGSGKAVCSQCSEAH